MKKNYNSSSRLKGWKNAAAMLALFTAALAGPAMAQEGSQGNTSIFGGAQMTFFGNHDFVAPAGGTQPGVILTERETATISYLNYSGASLTTTGASDASHVDGYVRKYGTGPFIFPVGDNGFAGQFAASADATSGAYFHADVNVAVTSNLFTGSAYPTPLPAGAPFARATKAFGVGAISPVEYWDIDGANATPITLTWDAGSAIGTLTSNDLTKLVIAGWNATTNRWEAIASAIDVTSVLGGASVLAAGSITTTASIVPDTYRAYTFASAILPDLTPAQFFTNTQLNVGQTVDYVAAVSNVGPESTQGTIQFLVSLFSGASGLTITLNPVASVTIDGDVFNLNNADFDVATSSTRFSFTSKAGVTIPSLGVKYIGFKITRTGGVLGSTNNTVTIINNTGGGETPVNNNTIANPIVKL